jgi:hypothetical protein
VLDIWSSDPPPLTSSYGPYLRPTDGRGLGLGLLTLCAAINDHRVPARGRTATVTVTEHRCHFLMSPDGFSRYSTVL